MNGIPFLVTAILCCGTALAILWVNSARLINQAIGLTALVVSLSFFCTYMAISIAGASPPTKTELFFWLRINGAVSAFIPWTLGLMKNAIVAGHTSLFRIIKLSWPLFLVSLALAGISLTDSYIPADSDPTSRDRGIGYIFFTLGIYSMIGFIMLSAFRLMQKTTGVRRIEMQFFLLNACIASLLVIVSILIRRIHEISVLKYASSPVVIVCLGVMIWAVSYHRIFDARQILAALGQRIAMLAILIGGGVGLSDVLSPAVGHRTSLVLAIGLSALIVFYCNTVTQKWLRLDIEHRVVGPRSEIISHTRLESDPLTLRAKFEELLKQWCQTDSAKIMTKKEAGFIGDQQINKSLNLGRLNDQGWLTPEHLQRLRPDAEVKSLLSIMTKERVAAIVASPTGSDTPSLLIALGPKHSLRPYTYPDITVLMNLAQLMDNILTHANLAQHAAKLAQMESAAMMSRSLAHDLNNLTTPVAAYLIHAEGRAKPGTTEAEVYDAALNSVKVMNNYIRESLFFSQRLVPRFENIDPADSLASVVRLARERASSHGVTIRADCEIHAPFSADQALFQRLALNLMNNAIDASPSGGTVTISLESKNSEQILLLVSDEGSGIPPENRKRIFDPYFTTKDTGDTGRGLGLGLAICRKIADLHGGEIDVTSSPGHGAIFTVVFPRKSASHVSPSASGSKRGAVSPSSPARPALRLA